MDTFTIDDYIIDKKRIGKGSFSTIYKGYHQITNTTYAIKEISVDNAKLLKNNIKREFHLMKKLNHPNIVKLHKVIIDNKYDNIYLILDYYKHGDLAHFLNKRPLKEMFAQKYMAQLASGLGYLLENKIIHRDLKPQNILISDIYTIKIADFGFARYFDNDNMIQTMCGSPMYMAPEITNKKQYNIKSDLWSVGVILYEMLFGCTPYKAKNIVQLIKNINKYPIEIPNDFMVSSQCENLLYRLLEKDPIKRIDWDDFLNHQWLKNNQVLEIENNLLNFSISSSYPNLLEHNKQLNQFNSFRHKSILDSEIEKSDILENLNIYNSSTSDESDNFKSFSDNFDDIDIESESNMDSPCSIIPKSKPIDIHQSNSQYVNISSNIFNKTTQEHMFKSINKEYVFVNPIDEHKVQSEPEKYMSSSFKDYLNSSIHFIKQSYNYISNNTKSI